MRDRKSPSKVRLPQSGHVGISAIAGLALLLVIPVYALWRRSASVDWRWLVGVPTIASLFAYFACATDKRRAAAGQWRISEFTLHAAELAGGWPGAFLAQRRFRHKISKASYQRAFWFIVLLHQWLAFDSLVGWKYTKFFMEWITSKIS